MLCTCPRERLCEPCKDSLFAALRGTAACRGDAWARSVAVRVTPGRPWPAYEGRAADIARSKVRDLTSDPDLLERLAFELHAWAARRWSR